MRRSAASLLWIFVLTIAVSSSAAGQERFESQAAGIALTKPTGWHTATLAQVQSNREQTQLSDPSFQAAMVARSAMPLVVFTKYAEPHQGLNPSIQVTPRAALAGSPTRLLAAAVEQMRAAFFDFRIVSPVSPVRVAGWPAAHVRITYTLKTQSGQSSKVLGRIWLIPRGPLMFLVGMSGADVGDDFCEDEFVATLDSLEIHK